MKKLKNIEFYKKSEKYPQIEWFRCINSTGVENALQVKNGNDQNVEIIIRSSDDENYFDTIFWNRGFWFIRKHNKSKIEKIDISKIDYDNTFVGFILWNGPWIGSEQEKSEKKLFTFI